MSGVSPPRRRPTSTSSFGVGRREGHDATAFYERFPAPVITDDDGRRAAVRDRSSPFRPGRLPPARPARQLGGAGRHLTAVLRGQGLRDRRSTIPRSRPPTASTCEMLAEVFAECVRVLEPGGRIAVNVANLGRKPYRSLSADVIRILQDELGLLLRGEVIWRKAEGASGNCAWGSFRSASNPVLRDVTERVVIAGKGRFDRAIPVKKRAASNLPVGELGQQRRVHGRPRIDVWDIPPESAKRVGHPAPFPVELPERLIHLYTYRERPRARSRSWGRVPRCWPRPSWIDATSATTSTRPTSTSPGPACPTGHRRRQPGRRAAAPPNRRRRRARSSSLPRSTPRLRPGDDFQATSHAAKGQAAQQIAEAGARAGRLPDRRHATSKPEAWGSRSTCEALDSRASSGTST